jgi:beta-lactamase class A
MASATIVAAPMSAAELAAQAREDMSAQRGRRDAEIEAEKEDAARQLEDEFEELESWEERARKLREKREALRKTRDLSAPPVEAVVVTQPPQNESDEDSEEDYDEDGWDNWGMRAA